MATFKQGILGGFNGKVGTVIGYSWKGKAVMRSIAQNVHNPNTEAQQAQRMRFSLMTKALAQLHPFVVLGFKNKATDVTEANAAFSANYANAVTGVYPNLSIDVSQLQLASGPLPLAGNPNATVDPAQHMVTVTWTNNSGEMGALDSDITMTALYNADLNQSVVMVDGADRAAESLTMSYPAAWSGANLAVYVAWRGASGNMVSNSLFLGSHES